eukprot:1686738-Pyramimonas_sp.AAC.1
MYGHGGAVGTGATCKTKQSDSMDGVAQVHVNTVQEAALALQAERDDLCASIARCRAKLHDLGENLDHLTADGHISQVRWTCTHTKNVGATRLGITMRVDIRASAFEQRRMRVAIFRHFGGTLSRRLGHANCAAHGDFMLLLPPVATNLSSVVANLSPVVANSLLWLQFHLTVLVTGGGGQAAGAGVQRYMLRA